MAFSPSNGSDERELSEINIIPLVDIMLVLLIIFMVAAPLMNDAVDVKLPKVKAKTAASDDESVTISIKKDSSIYIGKTEVKLENLSEKLTQIFQNREKKEVNIAAEDEANHGFVVKVMARIQRSGIFRISFLTNPVEE